MAYKMRDRKDKHIYVDLSSSSEEDYDSSYSDPDYTRTRPQRRSGRTNVVVNSSVNNPMQQNAGAAASAPAVVAAAGNSSRIDNGIVSGLPSKNSILACFPRRPGRPPKERVERTVQERPVRRRKRSLLVRRPRAAAYWNINGEEEPEKKKTIIAWLTDLGMCRENQRVSYVLGTGPVRLEGYLQNGGVLCDCCERLITVYEFEKHAAAGHLKQPYANIYCPAWGVNLLYFMTRVWQNLPEDMARCQFNHVQPRINATDANDDACMVCADGGDLICCEKCPSTFHPICMFMKKIPLGDWLCPFCICIFCSAGAGNVKLQACLQCERGYHMECFVARVPFTVNTPSTFCGTACSQVFADIQQKYLGVRNELGNGYSWSLVRMILENQPHYSSLDSYKIGVCNAKVAIAWEIMNEIFLPNKDRLTGINIIQGVLYNCPSNLRRINFRGFYTAILEKDDEIISVASIRVHGNKFAEMPFIGTRERFRKKGMLQTLLSEIESALRYVKVENLVIPSVPELVPMWTHKYGFSLVGEDLMKDLINYNTLMFPSAVRLQKSLLANAAGPSTVANAAGPAVYVLANGIGPAFVLAVTAGPSIVVANGAGPSVVANAAGPSVVGSPAGTYVAANSAGPYFAPAMEFDEAKINNEPGKIQGKNSRKVAHFDLNLEPPEDDNADA